MTLAKACTPCPYQRNGLLTMHSGTKAMSDVKLQSRMTSIFLLTSIFNESIHSSIAVFHLDRIHEQWKGRIETWQQRKRGVRKRRAARRSNCSSSHKDRGRASVPFVIPVAPLQTARQSSHGNDASAPDATRRGATRLRPHRSLLKSSLESGRRASRASRGFQVKESLRSTPLDNLALVSILLHSMHAARLPTVHLQKRRQLQRALRLLKRRRARNSCTAGDILYSLIRAHPLQIRSGFWFKNIASSRCGGNVGSAPFALSKERGKAAFAFPLSGISSACFHDSWGLCSLLSQRLDPALVTVEASNRKAGEIYPIVAVIDRFQSNRLTCQGLAQKNMLMFPVKLAVLLHASHQQVAVIRRLRHPRGISTRREAVKGGRRALLHCLMRTLLVILLAKTIEDLLLRSSIGRRRTGGFRMQGAVHAFMTSVLFRMSRRDAFRNNAQFHQVDRQAREAGNGP